MSGLDWQRVADIFADALERPAEERGALLDVRCADAAERSAVERMLAARERADPGFMDGLDSRLLAGAEIAEVGAQTVPERIGPWQVVEEIGRGGMGQVFRAERADGQFEQQVAIKLLKRGMDSDAILARFLRERQILAGLDHPHIARLLDGGIADDGRPYFVLEYVDGMPITDYADAQRLTIDARLELFRAVCSAVAYAHRNLIVHRDLKPSNILVTRDGRPKLLDFGIAKLLAAGDASRPVTLTGNDMRLMTPAYGAPEQFHGGPITTSTDVYGLGVVLFELLSGRRPFSPDADRFQLPPETEPVTLSSVVVRPPSGMGETSSAEQIAAVRAVDPVRLKRRLAGDLETIVAKALRATPERRYASVDLLHEDLQRHQEGLPVRARADTIGYLVSRFVRRHRVGVLTAAAVALLVLAFGVTATVQARAVAVERDRATREADAAREVTEFLVGVFDVADPMQSGYGDSIRATDLLHRGAVRIEADLAGQPEIQARLLAVIGRAFENLRSTDRAEPLLVRALELERSTAGPESEAVVLALQRLARVQHNKGDMDAAGASLREAIDVQQRTQPLSALLWSLQVDLANVHHGTGDYASGRAAVDEAMATFRQLPASDFMRSRAPLLRLADLMRFSRDTAVADSVFTRLIEVERATTGERSIPYAGALILWARARDSRGDAAGADSLLTLAVDIHTAFDPRSLVAANAMAEHASAVMRRGDAVRADSIVRTAIGILTERLGEDHRQVAFARITLSDALERQGRFNEAIALQRLAIATLQRDPQDSVNLLPATRWQLGVLLRQASRPGEAIEEFEAALATFEARYAPDYLLTAHVRRDYGEALVDVDRAAEAEPMLRQAIAVLAARWGEENARVDAARISLGRALTRLRRFDEADRELRAAHARLLNGRGPEDTQTKRARDALDELARARA